MLLRVRTPWLKKKKSPTQFCLLQIPPEIPFSSGFALCLVCRGTRAVNNCWKSSTGFFHGWQDPHCQHLSCACTAAALEPPHTHTDCALSRRDSLQIKCSSCSLHFLVWGTFTLQTSVLMGSFLPLGHSCHTTIVYKTFQTKTDLLLYKLRKLAWHAGFPPCSMGIGNMLPEHKTCNSCAATELMEWRKKEGKRDEYMETQTKRKPKALICK